jgi:hypothetical protein
MAGRRLVRVIGLVSVLGLASAALATAGVRWGTAIEVPGTAALNVGGNATVTSVSCASAGNCAAGGYYRDAGSNPDSFHNRQAFVVAEKSGVWGTASEVPGTAALNLRGYAEVTSVSCARAGNCTAVGFYSRGIDSGVDRGHVFVVDLRNGVWGTAHEMPGTAALSLQSPVPAVISCAGAGTCAAGFKYYDGSGTVQGFLADEKGEVWRKAKQLPGSSISCPSAGNCAAGGGRFVADEKNGVWGKAHLLNLTKTGELRFVSCVSQGNCAAGGDYVAAGGRDRAFVVSERAGVWGNGKTVPDTTALNLGPYSAVTSISCASEGNCAAGGFYTLTWPGAEYAFVIAEKNGVWGKAVVLHDDAGGSYVHSVSCLSAGNCVAVGFDEYKLASGHFRSRAFVLAEKSGAWQKATEVPGVNLGREAAATAVSCSRVGPCVIGGYYGDASGHTQAFLTAP